MSSLRDDTIAYGLAMAVDRLVGFLLLPVLTRLISPQDYGIWTQAVVATSMMIPIVLMGFQTALVQFFSATPEQNAVRCSLTKAMLLAILLALGLIGLGTAGWPQTVAGFVFGEVGTSGLAMPLFFLIITEAGHEFLIGHMRASGRIRRIAMYMSTKSVLRLLAPVAVLELFDLALGGVLKALAAAQAILLALAVWREMPLVNLMRTSLDEGKSRWASVLQYSLPLVLLAIMTMMHNFADRFFLAHMSGLETVAIYAATSSVVAMAAVFYTVQGFALFPALARLLDQGEREDAGRVLTRALHFFIYCAWPLILLLTVLSPVLLPMLTTTVYQASPLVFLLLGCAVIGFGLYQILLYPVLLSGRGSRGLAVMIAAVFVNSCLNFMLIPHFGVIGAAVAACLSNLLLSMLTGFLARQGLKFAFPWHETIDVTLRGALAALCIWWAGSMFDLSSPPALVAALFAGAVLYILPDMFRPGSPPRLLLGKS